MPFLSFLRENAPFLLAGILLALASSFGQTFFISIFAGEIRETFSLSHGEWGGIYTVGTTASAIIMLYAGGLADRYRIRGLSVVVILCLAASCLVMGLNQSVWLLPVLILALRFFGQGMLSHLAAVAMSRWFVATRGRALAIASLGFSIGTAFLPMIFVWLKRFTDWQTLWIFCAIVSVGFVPIVRRLLSRERTPQNVASESNATGMDDRHWTRAEVLRTPLFWFMLPALLMLPAFGTAFWFHQVTLAELKGWDLLSFVAIFPIGTAILLASTFLFGWLVDRVGTPPLLPIFLLPCVAAFTILWWAETIPWAIVGLGFLSFSGGAQATVVAAVWSEFFGTRYIGAIKALGTSIMVLGSALGPGLSGVLIDFGIPFDTQMLGYAVGFFVTSMIMIPSLIDATRRLPGRGAQPA